MKKNLVSKMFLMVLAAVLSAGFCNGSVYASEAVQEMGNIVDEGVLLEELEPGESVVVYRDETTGDQVEIELQISEPTKMTRDVGNSGWSGGYIPSSTSTLLVKLSNPKAPFRYLQYYVDVNGKTSSIISAYGLSYNAPIFLMDSCALNILNRTATAVQSARAEFSFSAHTEEYGIVLGTWSGYLAIELNYEGRIRTSWCY